MSNMLTKGSLNAAAVAHEMIKRVQKGEKIKKGEIIKKHGYTHSMSLHPNKVTNTKSFKAVVDPFVEKLKQFNERLIEEALRPGRKLTQVDILKISTSIKNTTHDIQILTGGDTERDSSLSDHTAALNELIKSVTKKKK